MYICEHSRRASLCVAVLFVVIWYICPCVTCHARAFLCLFVPHVIKKWNGGQANEEKWTEQKCNFKRGRSKEHSLRRDNRCHQQQWFPESHDEQAWRLSWQWYRRGNKYVFCSQQKKILSCVQSWNAGRDIWISWRKAGRGVSQGNGYPQGFGAYIGAWHWYSGEYSVWNR